MHNPGLIKTFVAALAITARRICVLDVDGKVQMAGAGAIGLMGVSSRSADVARDGPVDLIMGDIAEVEYGGNIVPGDPVTSDASGKAVKAAPAAGAQVGIIGFAVDDGDAGVFGGVRIAPGIVTGV